jgi:endonuclease IV
MSAFGIHISKQSLLGDYNTLEDAVDSVVSKYDFSACQIFTHGPQSRSRNNFDAGVLRTLEKANIYVHSTYLTDGYWSAAEENNAGKLNRYYRHIQEQLDATKEINGCGLVIHITRKTINILVKGMLLLQENIKQPDGVKIILEFRAMKPGSDCSYENAKQFNALCKALLPIKLDWGFCIDTSHMWATGVKMNDAEVVSQWFKDIDCGNKIILFHLNAASNSTFGVGKDIHIIPFAPDDDIWGNLTKSTSFSDLPNKDLVKIKKSTLGIILLWAKKNKVPIIGEFKRGSINELKFAIDVIYAILDL